MRNEINHNKSKKISLKYYILFVVCFVLAISSIFMTIENATIGLEMSKMEKNESELLNQKKSLEENLVKGLSLGDLQEKSLEMGFVKPSNLVYVSNNSSVTGDVSVAKLQ